MIDEEGKTALHCAVRTVRPEIVEAVCKRGVDIEAFNDNGMNALIMSLINQVDGLIENLIREEDVIDVLLKYGADWDSRATDKWRTNPPHISYKTWNKSSREMVNSLDYNQGKDYIFYKTANFGVKFDNIEEEFKERQEEILKMLKESKKVYNKDDDGEIIIHKAVKSMVPICVEEVCKRGIDVNKFNDIGKNPLTLAVLSGFASTKDKEKKIINTLLKYGANLDDKLETSHSARELMEGIAFNQGESNDFLNEIRNYNVKSKEETKEEFTERKIKLLDKIRESDDVYIKNSFGQTSLHFAVKTMIPKLVEEICKRNVDVNAVDNNRMTPLKTAVLTKVRKKKTRNKITDILIKYGADWYDKPQKSNSAKELLMGLGFNIGVNRYREY